MKSLLSILLFLTSFNSFAQSYRDEIAQHRENYKKEFTSDPRSPLNENDLKNLHFFEPDSNFRVSADVHILKNEKVFKMPTYDGTSKEFVRYARISFDLSGKKYSLTLYKNLALSINPAYKDLLFLPFTDLTNGSSSYGGGRYIDLKINQISKGKVIVDFNKAYNPYCAYSDGYRCPVPPEENDLQIEINAGEKNYSGQKKHKN